MGSSGSKDKKTITKASKSKEAPLAPAEGNGTGSQDGDDLHVGENGVTTPEKENGATSSPKDNPEDSPKDNKSKDKNKKADKKKDKSSSKKDKEKEKAEKKAAEKLL